MRTTLLYHWKEELLMSSIQMHQKNKLKETNWCKICLYISRSVYKKCNSKSKCNQVLVITNGQQTGMQACSVKDSTIKFHHQLIGMTKKRTNYWWTVRPEYTLIVPTTISLRVPWPIANKDMQQVGSRITWVQPKTYHHQCNNSTISSINNHIIINNSSSHFLVDWAHLKVLQCFIQVTLLRVKIYKTRAVVLQVNPNSTTWVGTSQATLLKCTLVKDNNNKCRIIISANIYKINIIKLPSQIITWVPRMHLIISMILIRSCNRWITSQMIINRQTVDCKHH